MLNPAGVIKKFEDEVGGDSRLRGEHSVQLAQGSHVFACEAHFLVGNISWALPTHARMLVGAAGSSRWRNRGGYWC